MGTTLTGTTPANTYDSLIKVTDNGPLSGSLKVLTDGLGNDSALALSTGAASVTGTLAVSSGITSTGANTMLSASSSTEGLVVRGGSSIGTPTTTSGQILIGGTGSYRGSIAYDDNAGYLYIDNLYNNNTGNIYFRTKTGGTAVEALTILGSGNVGIGTSSPVAKLQTTGSDAASIITGVALENFIATNPSSGNGVAVDFRLNNSGNTSVVTGKISTVNTFFRSNTDMVFSTFTSDALTEKARILSSGGITFNGDTSANNALNDYETGTFTPSFAPTVGAFDSITYSTQYGKYTKIGNRVDVNIQITASAVSVGTAGGVISIEGLPFTVGAKACPFSITLVLDWASGKFPVSGFFNDGAANCLFRYVSSLNSNDAYVGGADITNTSSICLMGTYFV